MTTIITTFHRVNPGHYEAVAAGKRLTVSSYTVADGAPTSDLPWRLFVEDADYWQDGGEWGWFPTKAEAVAEARRAAALFASRQA